MKILVVDDERVLVKGIKFNLESEGYQVEVGYDGEQAVELARQEQARLLVLDEVIDATYGFLPMEELCAFLDGRPEGMEVAITGHSLPPQLAERADYISHVVKEKHPYDRGVMARKEIEF